ncbi:MAG: biopolymer transporter ExbD [Dysgonamonadaceae bacterium]|jgi:biopolymer transport protein ExbD|nr:biopolymer transporter ExbD [Dysgonamonadaceae bacterium]
MAKVKVKKQSTWIDMTAMSDVTVLLLTFFMLTSTFVTPEPVTVTTPSSVSERKIPETDLMTVLVDSNGKIFMSFDNNNDKVNTLRAVGEDYGFNFTPQQLIHFQAQPMFGVPIRSMASFLDSSPETQAEYMKNLTSPRVGIPTEEGEVQDDRGVVSSDNEFKRWVSHAKKANPDLQIAIKADQSTNYPVVRSVMDDLRDLRENRYLLITSLKTASND